MKMEALARKHVKGFLVGQGFVDPHAEYLEKHLSEEELNVGARVLMADSEARKILIAAFQQFHTESELEESEVEIRVIKQINLVRSAIKFGLLGYLDD